jgi:hypothetical protein
MNMQVFMMVYNIFRSVLYNLRRILSLLIVLLIVLVIATYFLAPDVLENIIRTVAGKFM